MADATNAPAVGSRWVLKAPPEFRRPAARVMGTVEGWVVARYPRAMPFLKTVREWNAEFDPEEQNGKAE